VEESVIFVVLGLKNFHGLSIVLKKMQLFALFAICSRIEQNVLVEIHL
jgi:hypothetical protein